MARKLGIFGLRMVVTAVCRLATCGIRGQETYRSPVLHAAASCPLLVVTTVVGNHRFAVRHV